MLESSFTFGSSGRAPLLLEIGLVMEPETEMALTSLQKSALTWGHLERQPVRPTLIGYGVRTNPWVTAAESV